MKVINRNLMAVLRKPGLCQWCGRPCPDGRDPHHIFHRGAGRVDIPENLIALCRECHVRCHDGNLAGRQELLEFSASIHGTTVDEIERKVYALRADDRCKTWVVE